MILVELLGFRKCAKNSSKTIMTPNHLYLFWSEIWETNMMFRLVIMSLDHVFVACDFRQYVGQVTGHRCMIRARGSGLKCCIRFANFAPNKFNL